MQPGGPVAHQQNASGEANQEQEQEVYGNADDDLMM
jgi:hypothetical protein